MRDVYFGPEETRLHGVMMSAEQSGAPAAVLCHPHPQFGGSMNNNVVLGVETALSDANFTTLRFNFRGVGMSKGSHGDGTEEQKDVTYAIDFLAADASVGDIYLCGYSFGAMVGLNATLQDDRTSALVGIAPPTAIGSFDFLAKNTKPLLVIAGSQDNFCDIPTVKPIVEKAGGRLEIIPGADHFFINKEQRIGKLVRVFLGSL